MMKRCGEIVMLGVIYNGENGNCSVKPLTSNASDTSDANQCFSNSWLK